MSYQSSKSGWISGRLKVHVVSNAAYGRLGEGDLGGSEKRQANLLNIKAAKLFYTLDCPVVCIRS